MNAINREQSRQSNFIRVVFSITLAGILCITGFFGDSGGFAYAVVSAPIAIVIEDQPVVFTTKTGQPFIDENRRTAVPFRAVLEAFGATVSWVQETQTAVAKKGDMTVEIPIGKAYILKNGLKIEIDTKARVIDGRTYLPIRAVLKAFGAYVNWNPFEKRVEVYSNIEKLPIVTIEMETGQKMVLMLSPKSAPNTVNNFIDLVESGFYDGLTFHRVIQDFMIQGGCPLGTGTGGPGYSIPGEFTANQFVNTLKHTVGVISMARSAAMDSGGSQFFIMHTSAPYLDGQYAAFGRIVEGLESVDLLARSKTNIKDQPVSPLIMMKVTVETYGIEYPDPIKAP
jgi:peptidyl-prolyl cis-trans isomerase B (cyclophilin B)